MAIASWGALVHFEVDGEPKVVILFEEPEPRKELVGDLPPGWIADDVHIREEEIDGQSISYEVWVLRAEN